MKLQEFADNITEFLTRHPDAIVVFSSDEEGNSYDKVALKPTLGRWFDLDKEFDWEIEENTEEYENSVEAICIN